MFWLLVMSQKPACDCVVVMMQVACHAQREVLNALNICV